MLNIMMLGIAIMFSVISSMQMAHELAKKRNGTVIRPPPIPKSPAKKPTGNAVIIINKM